jgi:hypothetical protein
MTTGHLVNAETIRSRKQPKKTSSQATITRAPFNGNVRANLPIPDFIDNYNANMGQVDVANQLRAPYTAHFQRNCKEFFPGMFWLVDMVNVNIWKIFQHQNQSFLTYSTGNRDSRSHRKFLEILVDLLFLCTEEQYPEQVPQPLATNPFNYPRYLYTPREQLKRKAIEELLQPIRGVIGRPLQRIPATFTALLHHQHIPTENYGRCIICRNSITTREARKQQNIEINLQKEASIPGTLVLSFTQEIPREIEQEPIALRNRIRGAQTKWKCSECLQPIYKGRKGGKSCWDLVHRQIAR